MPRNPWAPCRAAGRHLQGEKEPLQVSKPISQEYGLKNSLFTSKSLTPQLNTSDFGVLVQKKPQGEIQTRRNQDIPGVEIPDPSLSAEQAQKGSGAPGKAG